MFFYPDKSIIRKSNFFSAQFRNFFKGFWVLRNQKMYKTFSNNFLSGTYPVTSLVCLLVITKTALMSNERRKYQEIGIEI